MLTGTLLDARPQVEAAVGAVCRSVQSTSVATDVDTDHCFDVGFDAHRAPAPSSWPRPGPRIRNGIGDGALSIGGPLEP